MSDDEREKYPSELAERFQVRLPPGMRDRLKQAADERNRSMNSEIVARLDASLNGGTSFARYLVQLLMSDRDGNFGDEHRDAVDALALLYLANGPAEELNTVLRFIRLIRREPWSKVEYDAEREQVLTSLNERMKPLLADIAQFLSEQGWSVEPPSDPDN